MFVELPVNILLLTDEIGELPQFKPAPAPRVEAAAEIARAAELLAAAKHPCIFAGWGARDASNELVRLAEWLEAPVATTLQGLSVFPANHPLHVGFGFGASAVPAAQNAFKACDCMIAIGTRFSEIATGSYGAEAPENLIHIDINPDVFNANFPAKVAIAGDAGAVLEAAAEGAGSEGAAPHGARGPARADQERQGRLSRELVSP